MVLGRDLGRTTINVDMGDFMSKESSGVDEASEGSSRELVAVFNGH
jgi:hypothetical protein